MVAYSKAWLRTSQRIRRERPICEWPGCSRPSTDVDHIDGRGERGDNSDANLMALCHQHHSRKTVLQDGGFGKRIPRRRPPEQHPGMNITPLRAVTPLEETDDGSSRPGPETLRGAPPPQQAA